MSTIAQLREIVIDGRSKEVVTAVERALTEGVAPAAILHEGLIDAMQEVGRLYEEGEYFVPEMLVSARAMKAGLEILRPHLVTDGVASLGRVVIGTVKGDLHDIGKSLVAMMLEGGGFDVVDLGVDVPPERFMDEIRRGADIIAMSALLTTTMPAMRNAVEAITAAGLREKALIMVGGAPVTEKFAAEIGADGYSADASSAVRKAKALLGK